MKAPVLALIAARPNPLLLILLDVSILLGLIFLVRQGKKVVPALQQSARRLRTAVERQVERSRFAVLVKLALARMLHSSDGDQDEMQSGVGVLLGLLAMPGAFVSIMLFEKYGGIFHYLYGVSRFDTLTEALRDEYFFVAFAMSVCGAVAVWKWDLIFPERRDFMVLAPLPLSSRSLFFANVTALAAFAGLFALDVNAISALLFPWVVCAAVPVFRFFVMFAISHGLEVLLASLFSFLAVFATVGALMALLPERVFRRLSVILRSLFLTGFLALLLSVLVVGPKLKNLRPDSSLLSVPAVWFVGICQVMRGRSSPAWSQAAQTGIIALLAALVIGSVTYAIAYRRYFMKIPERVEVISGSRSPIARVVSRWLDGWLIRAPFDRACYRFALKTLARSDQHRLLVTGFAALGLIVGFGVAGLSSATTHTPRPDAFALACPMPLLFSLLIGIRLSFDVPADLQARWIFSVALGSERCDPVPAMRKLMLSFALPLIWIAVLPVYWVAWGWPIGLLHAAVMTLAAALISDALLLNFNKIPFTCAPPAFGQNAIARALVAVLIVALAITILVQLELWTIKQPLALVAVGIVFLAGWMAVARYRRDNPIEQDALAFGENRPGAFELLNLSGH